MILVEMLRSKPDHHDTSDMKRISVITGIIGVSMLFSSCAGLYLNSGKTAYDEMKYHESIDLLEKGLAKKEDTEGRKKLAQAYMATSQYKLAAESYAVANVEPEMTDKDRMEYGKALMAAGEYDKALTIFEGILSREPGNPVATSLASACKNVNVMMRDSALFSVRPVNMVGLQAVYAPAIYTNGLIVSAEKEMPGLKDPYTDLTYTDLYFVERDGDTWKSPVPLNGVNGKYHDGIASLSKDGKTMYFTRSHYDGKRLGKDSNSENNTQIYFSLQDANGNWTEARTVPFNNPEYMYAHPSLSEDGKMMFFSSDMSGGFGGMDLYMTKLEETNWSKPVNLGANVNSTGDEVFPFLQSNDTLYFSSDSHTTLGGKDILYSVLRGGEWSKPYHLSYPINSPGDDFGVAIEPSGKTGYLSSDRFGSDRIYSFEMFNPELVLKGLVTGKNNMLPIGGAAVTVINITDGTEEVIYTDDKGEFSYQLVPGKNYRIKVEEEGHFAQTKELSTINKTKSEEIGMVFEMEELVVSTTDPSITPNKDGEGKDKQDVGTKSGEYTYAVPNIYWDYNKWDIRPDSEPYLDDLVRLFKDNPKLKVELRSHCDSRGSHAFNDELSQKRAKAVVDYLIAKGVKRSMLVSKGMGKRALLNRCSDGVECSEEEHQVNRRTEFIVLKK